MYLFTIILLIYIIIIIMNLYTFIYCHYLPLCHSKFEKSSHLFFFQTTTCIVTKLQKGQANTLKVDYKSGAYDSRGM